MLACPNCSTRLARQRVERGVVYACPKCGGQAIGLGYLHKSDIPESFTRDLWKKAVLPDTRHIRECPHCGRPMAEVASGLSGGIPVLDLCTTCQSVWFDPKEAEMLPHKSNQKQESQLSDEGKMLLAKLASEGMAEDRKAEQMGDPPDALWQQAVTLLGLPAVENDEAATNRPYMIWGLAAIFALVYFFIRRDPDTIRLVWGFIPEIWSRHGGATLITSFFLHAGFIHLAINIYFLLIFGDHLEGLLGRWRLAALLFGSHLAGLLTYFMFFPHNTEPLVGASAGIAGIIAYYAVSFPRARVSLMWGGFARGIFWIKIPVFLYLAVFIFGEMTTSFIHLGMSRQASLAHLGGMMVGVCAAIWSRTTRELKTEPSR